MSGEKSKLEWALALASYGFRVFPLIPNSKRPAVDDFPRKATRDEAQISAWWRCSVTGWEQNYNIGIATGTDIDGGHLAVVDVDDKNEKRGSDQLSGLQLLNDNLPTTFTVTTPSGGRHLYFVTQQQSKTAAGELAAGLDVRGWHGYVVGPGSTVDGKMYEISEQDNVKPCPPWFAELIAKARPRAKSATGETAAGAVLDAESSIARAREWLAADAPKPTEGQRSHIAYKVAARVKDFGISEPMCQALMLEWNETIMPPLPPEELVLVASNAYKYGTIPAGSSQPEAQFDDAPENASTPESSKKLYYVFGDQVQANLISNPLVKDLLDQGAMSVIYGASNTGKTFVMLDISAHVAEGLPWAGRKVQQGLVVYVAAEAGKSIHNRVAAFRKRHGVALDNLAVVPCPVDLFNRENDVRSLIDLVRDAEQAKDRSAVLVVVDTLSRAIAGGNENASEDMGLLVRNLDIIRTSLNCHLAVVHHSGKDEAKGARGHSLLRCATDTEIEVASFQITATKQRDMEFKEPIPFRLKQIELGKNGEGEPVTSCTVSILTSAEQDFGPVEVTAQVKEVLDVFDGMLIENPGTVDMNAWRDLYYATQDHSLVDRNGKKRIRMQFSRAWQSLVKLKVIAQEDEKRFSRADKPVIVI